MQWISLKNNAMKSIGTKIVVKKADYKTKIEKKKKKTWSSIW